MIEERISALINAKVKKTYFLPFWLKVLAGSGNEIAEKESRKVISIFCDKRKLRLVRRIENKIYFGARRRWN